VAVIGGTVTPCREITGVLIRRPCVIEAELPHIRSADRRYVAEEMSAFLFAWLTGLTCPVLNRPRDFHLLGPPWRPEQWVRAAAALGIATRPTDRTAPTNPGGRSGDSDAIEPVSDQGTFARTAGNGRGVPQGDRPDMAPGNPAS
jgi:hypothetical protein